MNGRRLLPRVSPPFCSPLRPHSPRTFPVEGENCGGGFWGRGQAALSRISGTVSAAASLLARMAVIWAKGMKNAEGAAGLTWN